MVPFVCPCHFLHISCTLGRLTSSHNRSRIVLGKPRVMGRGRGERETGREEREEREEREGGEGGKRGRKMEIQE